MRHWLLPEYLEDVLPDEAAHLEQVRRQLLDLFRGYGYQLVIPPLLEYTEALDIGAGHDLDLATFKVVDQLSGRLMGVRADITPQAARIDAHLLNRQGVARLCYAGDVLRTQPDGLAHTRNPLQVGAELFGHAGIESDIEIQEVMVSALQVSGVNDIQVDLSHVGIFGSLMQDGTVAPELEQALHVALQAKDKTALASLAEPLKAKTRQALLALVGLAGNGEVLAQAAQTLPDLPGIRTALRDLECTGQALATRGITVSFDLADLRGYHYHSGILFAAYAQGYAGPLALGGRYDEVGSAFGRARPATGFSLDLRGLLAALPARASVAAILAPCSDDAALREKIDALRASGEIVITDLPGHAAARAELGCDRVLANTSGTWTVVPIKP